MGCPLLIARQEELARQKVFEGIKKERLQINPIR